MPTRLDLVLGVNAGSSMVLIREPTPCTICKYYHLSFFNSLDTGELTMGIRYQNVDARRIITGHQRAEMQHIQRRRKPRFLPDVPRASEAAHESKGQK